VTASVTHGRALRYAEGSARGLLHHHPGHCPLPASARHPDVFGSDPSPVGERCNSAGACRSCGCGWVSDDRRFHRRVCQPVAIALLCVSRRATLQLHPPTSA